MTHYTVYKTGHSGDFDAGVDVFCATDELAILAASSLPGVQGFELWEHDREVARSVGSDFGDQQ